MITGAVNDNREAVVVLQILNPAAPQGHHSVQVVVDTGFNGYLTLPEELIHDLRLPAAGYRRVVLGDGCVVLLSAHLGKVRWHEHDQEVLVLQAQGCALLGMSLLYGSRVTMEVVDNGDVTIEAR